MFFLSLIYLKDRATKKGKESSICWFSPQMVPTAKAELCHSRSQELHLGLSH